MWRILRFLFGYKCTPFSKLDYDWILVRHQIHQGSIQLLVNQLNHELTLNASLTDYSKVWSGKLKREDCLNTRQKEF